MVLDEADRMLDMGFVDDIKFILSCMSKEDRQTNLFSATMPAEVLKLAQEYMDNPKEIRLNEEELSLDTIDQAYLIIHEKEKFKHLCNFIRNKNQKQTIVFAATKQRTHRLASELQEEGFRVLQCTAICHKDKEIVQCTNLEKDLRISLWLLILLQGE